MMIRQYIIFLSLFSSISLHCSEYRYLGTWRILLPIKWDPFGQLSIGDRHRDFYLPNGDYLDENPNNFLVIQRVTRTKDRRDAEITILPEESGNPVLNKLVRQYQIPLENYPLDEPCDAKVNNGIKYEMQLAQAIRKESNIYNLLRAQIAAVGFTPNPTVLRSILLVPRLQKQIDVVERQQAFERFEKRREELRQGLITFE